MMAVVSVTANAQAMTDKVNPLNVHPTGYQGPLVDVSVMPTMSQMRFKSAFVEPDHTVNVDLWTTGHPNMSDVESVTF
jgi:hypothetical protein